jgi:hypothetical protein
VLRFVAVRWWRGSVAVVFERLKVLGGEMLPGGKSDRSLWAVGAVQLRLDVGRGQKFESTRERHVPPIPRKER